MAKQPEPKVFVVEPEHEAREILTEIREAHHDELEAARIELLWILSPRTRKGRRVLGTCQIAPEKLYRLTGIDILIELDHEWWQGGTDTAKRYLVDHELCHAGPKIDEDTGEQVVDLTGRLLWVSLPHDLEDFADPIARWGVQPDLERFLEQAQLSLPGLEGHVAKLRAKGWDLEVRPAETN